MATLESAGSAVALAEAPAAARDGAWERAYALLVAYAREHGAGLDEAVAPAAPTPAAARCSLIVATPRSLSVPRALRTEFYALVNAAQGALCRAVLGARLDTLVAMARECAAVRTTLVAQSNLREFRLASALEALLADPAGTAARPLFSVVLDGLQNARSAAEVESAARETLPAHAEPLYRAAYEARAYYGVVARLRPRTFYATFSPDLASVRAVPSERIEVGMQTSSPTLRMPEAVFETADGRTFAMKTEAAHELDFYGFKNKRRRDNSAGGVTSDLVSHRVLLLWELPSVEAVGFVADREKMRLTPTDLTCEVLAAADMATPAYVSMFVDRINAVRSKRPVQVIAPEAGSAFPEGMLDDPTVAPLIVRRPASDTGDRSDGTLDEVLDAIAHVLAD